MSLFRSAPARRGPYGAARPAVNRGPAHAAAPASAARPAVAFAVLVAAVLLAPAVLADPLRILALGDSLIAGYGLARDDSPTVQLERLLRARGHDVVVVNGGVSGDTTQGGLARLDWMLKGDPDAVILELGANDALRGIDPAVTRSNLDAILARLDAAGLPVLVAGMKAMRNMGPEYQAAFERIYPDLAERHGVLLQDFVLEGIALDPALNQADGIHPNAAGARRMAEGMLPHVEALIARARADAG